MKPSSENITDPLAALEEALHAVPNDAAQADVARSALQLVSESAAGAGQPSLCEFAGTLNALVDLLETQRGSDQDNDEETAGGDALADFVRQGLGPLRAAVANEPDAEQKLRDALEAAKSQWGEYLSLLETQPSPVTEQDAWEDSLQARQPDTWTAEADSLGKDAPGMSRVDVDRMLASLAEMAADTATAEQEATEQPTSDKKTKAGRSHILFGETNQPIPDEPPPPAVIDMDADLLEAYLDDASAGVGRLEQLVLAVESAPGDESLHRQICRELHTLKGASASVGLSDLAGYLHAVEDYVDAAAANDVEITPMLNSVDAVRRQIDALAGKSPPVPETGGGTTDPRDFRKSLGSAVANAAFEPAGSGQEESLRVKSSRVDRLMDLLAELVILRNQRDSRLSRLKDLHAELTRCVTRLRVFSDGIESGYPVRSTSAVETGSRTVPDGSTSPAQSAGEGITGRGPAGSMAEIASDVAELARSLRELAEPMEAENVTISQFIRQFRSELMEMRRLPVAGLFQRLNRAARDAARSEGKSIEFQLQGEHAGLDRSLQERLYEPLLHMVRNAVSHGIESADDRRKAGKPETGRIVLAAKGSPTTLVIEVSDDGRGLDYEAIRRKALDNGLLSVGEAADEAQLARLIFHPGFSTRQETSEISGRGVGMDVVATSLQRLRAKIDVESRSGAGSTMRLTIPLRSVIEHAMVVRICGRLYALPMQFVQAAGPLDEEASQVAKTADGESDPNTAGSRTIVRLRTLLGENNAESPAQEQMVLLGTGRLAFSAAVQGRTSSEPSGTVVIVDEVVGPDEVVVRSLPALLKSHPLLGGVTLSGAGEIVQLLDGQHLLDYAGKHRDSTEPETQEAETAGEHQAAAMQETQRVLVVDDSLSARRRLVGFLRSAGFEVAEAGDGFEGLDRYRNETFCCVFTDLEMPRLDGFGLLSEIKSDAATNPPPVIVVSSRAETESQERARQLGADDYLVKPVAEAALNGILNEIRTSN